MIDSYSFYQLESGEIPYRITLSECRILADIYPRQAANLIKNILNKRRISNCYFCNTIFYDGAIEIIIDRVYREVCDDCYIDWKYNTQK